MENNENPSQYPTSHQGRSGVIKYFSSIKLNISLHWKYLKWLLTRVFPSLPAHHDPPGWRLQVCRHLHHLLRDEVSQLRGYCQHVTFTSRTEIKITKTVSPSVRQFVYYSRRGCLYFGIFTLSLEICNLRRTNLLVSIFTEEMWDCKITCCRWS